MCGVYLLLSMVASTHTTPSGLIAFALGISLLLQMMANPVFVAADILITARCPTPQQLSEISAIGEVVACVAVGTGASTGSALFAASTIMTDSFWSGKMVWIVLSGITAGTALISQRLTHIPGWREKAEAEESVLESEESDV